MKKIIILIFMTTFSLNSQILNEKERANKINEILKNRFDNVLPELMDKTEIDMWILISREYNEDPVLKTMLPAEWLNARRRTIIVFYRDKLNDSLDKLAVARYNFGDNIISAWDKDKQPDQWKRLNEIIEERNPQKIGLNYSKYFNIADGLDKTDHDEFMANISEKNMNEAMRHLSKSLRYFYAGDYREALKEVDLSLELNPNMALAYARRGSIYYKLGDVQRATINWNLALRYDPEYTDVRNILKALSENQLKSASFIEE